MSKWQVDGYPELMISLDEDEHRETIFKRIYVWRSNSCVEPFIDQFGIARYWVASAEEPDVQQAVSIVFLMKRII